MIAIHTDTTTGKVHIVTGGYAGCGHQLSKILYQHNATVYIAGRSPDKAYKTIESIKADHPNSSGKLVFLQVDFSDLATIKPAVEEFTSKESHLNTLTNNAGVMNPPSGSKDKQGYELQLGTNCLGPFLFSKLLTPILKKTAEKAPADTVRVTWAASMAVGMSPKGGVTFKADGVSVEQTDAMTGYSQSKAANCLLAAEYAQHHAKDGIVSVSWNPGNLQSELQRHTSPILSVLLKPILYPARFGAYTELYAALSPAVTAAHNGAYVAPWGRINHVRADVMAAMKRVQDGGTGQGEKFWDYCERETSKYA